MIERKIIIGLITSTDYLRQIRSVWDVRYLESSTAKRMASWVWEHFEKYDRAPGKDIENIFYDKLRDTKIPKGIASEIEEDILPSLSSEHATEEFNLSYMLDITNKYFKERHLRLLSDTVDALLEKGEVIDAEQMVCDYKPIADGAETDLDLSHPVALDRVDKAFSDTNQVLIEYPRQLGEFWNHQFVRGGLVSLMATEKRGKTFWLLDIAVQACRCGRRVAFFQAGDMTESQQLKRICIRLSGKSDLRRYSGVMWEPVRDCVYNQNNTCHKPERNCSFGIFDGRTEKELRSEANLEELIEAYNANEDYEPCTNCDEYEHREWGTPWIRQVDTGDPLNAHEARNVINQFFIEHRRQFKLSSHANDTLTINQIKATLSTWEKQDGFVPDVIIIDYADLLTTEERLEERARQNKIWKGLRRLSQERGQPLVITATQADADAYERDRLKMKNFSEDKRKYAHVTAMYGLNQDTKDREKKIGLMRINEIVVREGDFSNYKEITVLQNLRRGRPFIGSYW